MHEAKGCEVFPKTTAEAMDQSIEVTRGKDPSSSSSLAQRQQRKNIVDAATAKLEAEVKEIAVNTSAQGFIGMALAQTEELHIDTQRAMWSLSAGMTGDALGNHLLGELEWVRIRDFRTDS